MEEPINTKFPTKLKAIPTALFNGDDDVYPI
jgi:hypothetical protein